MVRQLTKLDGPYLVFAALRIILTCLPQRGYVHPDEYFQSIEVTAEKVLGVQVNKPWEFNTTFPIRSVALPYLTAGMSLQFLKILNILLQQYFGVTITTTYFIVLFPRLLMCCLSFLVDWSLYRICSTNSEKFRSRCLILCSSYIMLVYGTRTFSNTIELILFALLLYYVADSIIFSTITVRQREYINKRYNAASTAGERAKFHKLRLYLEDDSLRNCFKIATIAVAGFFNRPTFIAYAVAPIFLWLYRGLGFRSVASLHFHLRTFVFLVLTVPTIVTFIIIDSFYFGYLTWAEIGVLKVSLDNFVVTPLNFIKYNINPKNLAEHGLHPRYLHALVNVPLLFSILAAHGYSNVVDLCSNLIQAKYHYLPTSRSIKGLMTASFLVPLVMLSVFPHQEPRFLIPLLVPLVYLYGPGVLSESVDTVAKSFMSNDVQNSRKAVSKSYVHFKAWMLINITLTIFYGFIHQGGIFPFVSHLNNEMRHSDYRLRYEVVTSHVYTIPESLLYQKYDPYSKYVQLKRLTVHEEGSKSLENVLTKIETLLNLCRIKTSARSRCKLYLVLPTSLTDSLHYHFNKCDTSLIWHDVVTFYFHVSTEALPQFPWLHESYKDALMHPVETLASFLKGFGLARIEFKLNATATS